MKQILGLIMSIILLLTLAACGQKPEATEAPGAATAAPTEPATEAATEAPTEPEAVITDLEMDNTVLVDDENCTFSVQLASKNEHLGLTLDAQCVNKTDKNLYFTWNTVSVCGYMYDPLWAEQVPPNATLNSTIYIDTYQLEQYGITSVDEITFTLHIFDGDDFMAEPFVNEPFTIYPTGLNVETVQYPQRTAVGGEQVIADNDDLRFIIETVEEDNLSYTLRCYAENKTGTSLMFSWDGVTVNSMVIDPLWAIEVAPGKQAYSEITFYRSQFEENGIESVEEISFQLTVSDWENWEADYLLDERFTVRAEDFVVG